MVPLLANPTIPRKTSRATTTTITDSGFTVNHNPVQTPPIPRLRDTQGTPTPAAANPFIFKRGTGRPDEPPEAAGAPNRPKETLIMIHAK
ncbi:hypothetical protein [Nitrososphaera viennensis]|nr:hypothetical protein [Nitrososphaera viennensis]UVS68548.1 hypothetical protein NWT39_11625 [Nitrososphaera viennensis]